LLRQRDAIACRYGHSRLFDAAYTHAAALRWRVDVAKRLCYGCLLIARDAIDAALLLMLRALPLRLLPLLFEIHTRATAMACCRYTAIAGAIRHSDTIATPY